MGFWEDIKLGPFEFDTGPHIMFSMIGMLLILEVAWLAADGLNLTWIPLLGTNPAPLAGIVFGTQAAVSGTPGPTTKNYATPLLTPTIALQDIVGKGSVTATFKGSINGAPLTTITSGTTEFAAGDVVDVLAINATTYHNSWQRFTITEGMTQLLLDSNKNSSATITGYDPVNSVSLTNGGGANNETISAGEDGIVDLTFRGTSATSTQDMVCVVETSNKNNQSIANAQFDGQSLSLDVPASYTLAGTSSGAGVFEMSALSDSKPVVKTLTLPSVSATTDMSGGWTQVKCFTKEHFQDTSSNGGGVHKYAIEDAAGTLKSMGQYTFKFYYN